jgi:DNA-binding response OmpR family regulator
MSGMRILIVEDDSKMAELLRRGLAKEGHSVTVAIDGSSGLEEAQTRTFDVVVLDIMLPSMNGLTVARRLRSAGNRIPILMLTGRDAAGDIVRGLDAGADDYLTKPFSFEVLTARLRVIARRLATESGPLLQVADLTLNTQTHDVSRAGRTVVLTRTEFEMLEYLMRCAGRIVSRDSLIEAIWGIDRDVGHNTVDVFIFQLRSKIDAEGTGRLIQTIRGFGYTIRESEHS